MTLAWDHELLKAGDGHIGARIAGRGRSIVMLHSLLADSGSFEPLAGLLVHSRRVVLFDLPGFHDSELVEGALEAVADRVADGIRALELADQPDLLGNGYGGFVAQLVAIRHPGLIDRLVLADTGACFPEQGREAFRMMSKTAREKGLAAIADVAMRRLFSPEFQAANPELVAAGRERFIAMDPRTFQAACAALATLDLRMDVSKIRVPVMVLAGEMDEATPFAMSQELALLLPGAELKMLTGCGHVPQLQDPPKFLDAIASFLGI